MTGTSLALPKNIAGMPAVQNVLNRLSRANAAKRDAEEQAEWGTAPLERTMSIQAGAALSGGLLAWVGSEKYPLYAGLTALAGIVGGSLAGSPHMVDAANGMLAPLVAQRVFASMVRQPAAGEPVVVQE